MLGSSFSTMWRNSPVVKQVPMIEQCRLAPNSQTRVRRDGPSSRSAADVKASRKTSAGGAPAGAPGRPLLDSIWASFSAIIAIFLRI
jgi:hypothetical protein